MAAFAGIASKNYDPNVSYQVYVVALLALAFALLLVKILIVIATSPICNGTDKETKGSYSIKGHIPISVISQ